MSKTYDEWKDEQIAIQFENTKAYRRGAKVTKERVIKLINEMIEKANNNFNVDDDSSFALLITIGAMENVKNEIKEKI